MTWLWIAYIGIALVLIYPISKGLINFVDPENIIPETDRIMGPFLAVLLSTLWPLVLLGLVAYYLGLVAYYLSRTISLMAGAKR